MREKIAVVIGIIVVVATTLAIVLAAMVAGIGWRVATDWGNGEEARPVPTTTPMGTCKQLQQEFRDANTETAAREIRQRLRASGCSYQGPPAPPVRSQCDEAFTRLNNSDTTYEYKAAYDEGVRLSCRWVEWVTPPTTIGNEAPTTGYDTGSSDTPIADDWQQRMADKEAQRKADWEIQQAEWDRKNAEWDADMCQRYKEEGYC